MFGGSIVSRTLFLGFLLVAATGSAQVVTGVISGRVTDPTGAVIPGTTVQVENIETGFSRNVQTDAAGRYEARNLPVGSYSITAQQAGFRTVRRGITLTVASAIVVNLELSVGTVQETVEVTAEAPNIETSTATLSGLVGQDQMRALPLSGRSYDQLTLLAPGLVHLPNSSTGAQSGTGLAISSHGARNDANLYLIDGTTANDHSNRGPGSAAGLSLGVEAVREFRILTHSYSAEYGRNAGAVISAITRSGTNEFHGSAYEFLRNNVLDARNFFNPEALPPFRQNQFGASLGGPLRKDRIFFFVNYEGFRQRQGVTQIATVPDENARQGLLPNPSTGVVEPVTLNPVIVPYLKLYPLPNGRNFGNGSAQFIRDTSTRATEDYYMGRMDFRLSDKDSVYWRYIFDPSETFSEDAIPPFFNSIKTTNHYLVLSETHVFSGEMLNEVRGAFNRTAPFLGTGPLEIQNHALDFLPGAGFGDITSTVVSGGAIGSISGVGTDNVSPQSFPQNTFQISNTLSYVKGAHSWKFGFNGERIQTNTHVTRAIRGTYAFTSLRDMLAGIPRQVQFFLVGENSNPSRGWRQTLFGWFVQDDIRLRPNLTLNLGFRHEFLDTPSEVNGRTASFRNWTDPESTVGPPWTVGKLNFAPRVGMVWDPTGQGETSIRLGGGVFYNHLVGRAWQVFSKDDPRFTTFFQVRNPRNFPNALQSGFQTGGAVRAKSAQWEMDTSTLIHYNLEIQQQLFPTISIQAGYVGSYGYDLIHETERMTRIPQILPDGSKFFSPSAPFTNPNPAWSSLQGLESKSISNYNALQIGFAKSFSRGLMLHANYRWSKVLSTGDSISSSQVTNTTPFVMDIDDLDRDYGLAAYDQRHSVSLNGRYRLPWDNLLQSRLAKAAFGGWEVNGIFLAGSGFPVGILAGFNNSQNGNSAAPDRPNLAPGFSNDPTHHGATGGCQGVPAGQKLRTPDLWYDPCAFELSPAGTFGNLGRNTVSGPPSVNVNLTLAKKFPVREGMDLEFRSEFFNIFNHANFRSPSMSVFTSGRDRSGNAGVITATSGTNRQIQFGLKLTF
ncbi:MAG: TonB-dependent receptor [Acidobacteria bacterium]|nr:TonB-dependent receptor [Acidobacteriota bacterium]